MKTAFWLLLTSLWAFMGYAQPVEKRLALVIGNGDYRHTTSLPKAINNVSDLVATLQQVGFEVVSYKNLDRVAMKRAIHDYGQRLKGYQTGLIYYTGHGILAEEQQLLVPTDVDLNNMDSVVSASPSVSQFVAEMQSAQTKTNIILIDCDRNNPAEQKFSRNSSRPVDIPLGFVIAYATLPGRPLVDNPGRNSLYTAALLRAIAVPNQSLIQTLQTVRAEVMRQSTVKQMPLEMTSLTDDFFFLKK